MKQLILSGAVGALALALSACGDRTPDATASDAATAGTDAAAVDTTQSTAAAGATATTASADWPKGTRIIEEGGKTYRVAPDGTRVVIDNNEWRIVTEDGQRYRVSDTGTRVRIGDDGVDIDTPIDVDLGVNKKGNLDLDVSADGKDANH
jgi:hypothetical protein